MKLTLLKIIASISGIKLPFLKAQASIEAGTRPGDGDLEAALRELKADGFVVEGQDEMTRDRTFTATKKGEAAARRH